ncbi:MAG TPA: AAA family ATPase [Candidatus Thioglobus sp.]|nr:AAA family ATPase [Candidatus Thioglobus sp.]
MIDQAQLQQQATELKLHGILEHWHEISNEQQPLLAQWFTWEVTTRKQRSLERRLTSAKLGRFKALTEFDWVWPTKIDQPCVHRWMQCDFLAQAINPIIIGSNGVGKSTIAQNIAYQAVMLGHTVIFTSAANMLNELAAQDGDNALRRRLAYYAKPALLVIDEVGYLSYSNRHADLLFEIINRRYEKNSTIVTTNRPFGEWNEVFPNAACVVSLIDRLVHHSEVLAIEGDSYRMKEAKEQANKRKGIKNAKHSRKGEEK